MPHKCSLSEEIKNYSSEAPKQPKKKNLEKTIGYKSHDKAIFWGVVLVLILIDQTHPRSVVSLSLYIDRKKNTEMNIKQKQSNP